MLSDAIKDAAKKTSSSGVEKDVSKAKRGSKPKEEYVPDIRSMMIEQQLNKLFFLRENREEVRAGLHASAVISSDSEFCYRQQVLSLLYKQNQGENHPVKLMRIFAAGNNIHEKWQKLFEISGMAYAIEDRSFSDEYEIYFTPDAIVMIGGKKWVCEIKSVNTYQFQKMKSHPSGRKQIQLYMHLKGLPRGFILCEDKNTQDIKIFIEEYDPDFVAKYLHRLLQVQKFKKSFLKTKTAPPRVCTNKSCKKANGCNMRDACWNTGQGRQRL